ncbi:MAG: class I SAM-dependent methyltransferase [Planctomycetota bacterium]
MATRPLVYYARNYLPRWLLASVLEPCYAKLGKGRAADETFEDIFEGKGWGDHASVSGPGSTMEGSERLRAELPGLLGELGVKRMLDVPCGDLHWLRSVDLGDVHYIGGDIVEPLIEKNRAEHAAPNREFHVLDLCTDDLPDADLIMVRDCFIHLPFEMILKALGNIRRSGIRWLLASTFPDCRNNLDIPIGLCRPVNLERYPIRLPKPDRLIREDPATPRPDKDRFMGVWPTDVLPGG